MTIDIAYHILSDNFPNQEALIEQWLLPSAWIAGEWYEKMEGNAFNEDRMQALLNYYQEQITHWSAEDEDKLDFGSNHFGQRIIIHDKMDLKFHVIDMDNKNDHHH